jgi:hypothetical protein
MSTQPNKRPWWQNWGCLLSGIVALLLVGGAIWIYLSLYQGRDIARVTGIPVKIGLPDCVQSYEQVVSISFHSISSGETVKDVTYICNGLMYSQEYNDFGILQGSIEWTLRGR